MKRLGLLNRHAILSVVDAEINIGLQLAVAIEDDELVTFLQRVGIDLRKQFRVDLFNPSAGKQIQNERGDQGGLDRGKPADSDY